MALTRFPESQLIEYEGEQLFGIREKIDLAPERINKRYSVQSGDTLKDIAYKVYSKSFGVNATKLWWIIAEVNDIIDPFEELEVGTELKYPSPRNVMEYVF